MVKKNWLIISLLTPFLLIAQSVDIDAFCEPYPTPFISEWQQKPGIFSVTLTNNTSNNININIKAEIRKNGELIGDGYKNNIALTSYGVKNLDNIDFLELNDWNYNEDITDNIIQTNRLPEGDYEICFQYLENRVVASESCVNFEIVIPDIPDLISPTDDMSVDEIFPRFEWTPAFVPADMMIKYRVILCRNDETEDLNYSITKIPILNITTENNAQIYPAESPPLETGEYYVWQVQLLDKNSNPIGENEGKSEIGRFLYGSSDQEGGFITVNDGDGEDVDWVNGPGIQGNWAGDGDDFYYAVGTDPGNNDILDWTGTGAVKSFSTVLNLDEGAKYYISVKNGMAGQVFSSDGFGIDLTPPVSHVNSLADSLQSPFDVKWSGSDTASGIAQYIIQRREADSSFADWVTVTDSATGKSFSGETGKTYYFRSKAIDKAGNEENYPDSADAKTYVKKSGDSTYVLVPNVAYLKITDSTKVETKDDKTTLKGKVKLVIEPTPFDNFEKEIDLSDSTICDSSHMTFKKDVVTNALEPEEGNITISDSTGLKEVYKDVLKIVSISFGSKRPTDAKMMVDSAFIQVPFNIPKMNNSNLMPVDSLPITAAGLAFSKELNKEWSKWGMTFTFKQLSLAVEEAPPYIKAAVNVKMNKKDNGNGDDDDDDDDENFATNATIGFRGKNDVVAHIVPDDPPMQLIPDKEYVMLDSIWFEKPDDEWKLGAALQFKYPEPLDDITDQSKASILIGDDGFDLELALINEERKSTFDDDDDTALEISDYVSIDLTNVDLKLISTQNNGKMELDKDHSYVEFMADLYLGEKEPKRIAIGDPDENKKGFKVTFAGDPQAPGVKVKDNPFDIGPVRLSGFTEGSGLGINFEPFEISLSGGIGINKPGTFEGSVNFENLIINKDGLDFSDFMVLGGDIQVMDVVTASIDSIGYSAEPTTLTFEEPQADTSKVEKSVEVDSYFRLAGAELGLEIGGDGGGGGCEEFLLYEVDNNTNVVIREAWFEIKNTCKLSADLTYAESPDPLLNFSGSVEIKESGIKGIAVGKIGARGGSPTFGIFLAASGINANMGAVTLNEVGGGFFYRPLQSDIDRVKELVGLEQGSLMQNDITAIIQDDIPATNELTFAAMLYAGIYVQSKEICEANGMITLTSNYFELLAKAKMLDKQGEGNIQLLINWAPYTYGEGHIDFKMKKKHVVDIEQNLEFFAYSSEIPGLTENIWAVMGNGNVDVFPSTIATSMTTEFFIGPPGFFFDVDIEKSYDFWIIDGSYGFGTMFWWERGVSLGAYADVHGSLNLDHVAGISCGLEGALIYADSDLFIYSVGSFKAKFCGETVYNGSIWVSLGTNGIHGDKGRNSTYDGYIESAKNMADDMKDEIENMSEDIEDAKETASQLSEEQMIAAGEALYDIVGGNNLADINDIQNQYLYDINDFDHPNNNLQVVYNDFLFFPEAQQLNNQRDDLADDSLEIASGLTDLNSNSDQLINRMQSYKSRVAATLPHVAETMDLSNPVDTGYVQTIQFDNVDVNIPVGTGIDADIIANNSQNAANMRQDIKAYKDSLLSQSDNIIDDLVYADSLLYRGNVSVNSLSIDYYRHSTRLSENTAANIRYYYKLLQAYGGKAVDLQVQFQTAIEQELISQVNNIPEGQINNLIALRVGIRNYLLRKAGEPGKPMEDLSQKTLQERKDYCVEMGMEVWYDIPYHGMMSITNNTSNGIQSFVTNYENRRSQFYNSWNSIGNSVETIHNVKSQSYEYLYDLYNAMSWEYEDGGPNNNLNNPAAQFGQDGYQFGGEVFGNFNGGVGQMGGFNFQSQNFMGNFGGQNAGNFGNQHPGGNQMAGNISPETLALIREGLSMGTAAKKIRDFDTYSEKREYIGSISTPPAINKFSGTYESLEESYGYYGVLTLDYEAEHSAGGCFYNVNIPTITNGPLSLGVGKSPSFFIFQPIDPKGSYQIELTAFANSGYNITNRLNFPVDYYTVGFEDIEGGEVETDLSFEDDTKPLTPEFLHAYFESRGNELRFHYQSQDPESGISEYQYALADSVWYDYTNLGMPPVRHINFIKSWESTGGRRENVIQGLTPEHGDTYFVCGKTKNGANMWSNISVSEKINVDRTSPEAFTITGFEIAEVQNRFSMVSTKMRYELSASWTESQDPESEVIYVVGLGTESGEDDLIPFGPVFNNQSYVQNQVFDSKSSQDIYFLTVKAINTAGLEHVEHRKYNITVNNNKSKGK